MKPIRRLASCLGLAMLTTLGLTSASRATLNYTDYSGPNNGLWSDPNNWTPYGPNQIAGVPQQSTYARIGIYSPSSGGSNLSVTLDISANFLDLTLDAEAITGYVTFNQTTANTTMQLGHETIGSFVGQNRHNHSTGTNLLGTLDMGVQAASTNNYYNLSGNGVLAFQQAFNIGLSGSGTVNQTGGQVTGNFGAPTQVTKLGVNAGGIGTYNLSAGTFYSPTLQVGLAGTGTFTQTGGSVNVDTLQVSSTSGGSGVYNMSAGTLTGYVHVNQNGVLNLSGGTLDTSALFCNTGTFNLQTSGIFSCPILNIGSGGVCNFLGGSITKAADIQFLAGGGTLNLRGHNFTATDLYGPSGIIQNGSLGTITLTVNSTFFDRTYAGVLQNGGSGLLSVSVNGSHIQTLSGTNTYTGNTTLTAGTLLAGSDTAFSPGSAFLIFGGMLDTGGFHVTLGSLSGSAGTVQIGTGSISSDGSALGYGGLLTGSGIVHKTGPNDLSLAGGGSFTGTFDVQGGSLTASAVNGIPNGAAVSLSGFNTALNVAANQTLGSLAGGVLSSTNYSGNAALTIGGNNTDTSYGTNFTGAGTLNKVGTGNFTLGYGPSDTVAGNTDSALVINVNAGKLTLSKAAGTTAVAGALNINGGSVVLASSNQIADSTVVSLIGGTFSLAGFSETIGGLAGSGTIAPGGGVLTVAQAVNATYTGLITGAGSFIKTGAADLTLTGTGSYTGSFAANAGRLTLPGTVTASSLTANNGGTLQLKGTVTLNGAAILANTGGAAEYQGATITNGFMNGPGTHTILAGGTSTFSGITTGSSAVIVQNGPAALTNFTNGGTLTGNAALTTQNFTSNGGLTINSGGTLSNSVSSFTSSAGSRTTINSGGTLSTASGTTIDLNGALFTNNGTQTGVLNVNSGSTLKGSGTFGSINVNGGGTFSPGNSPGTATVSSLNLGSGGSETFEINSAGATPGIGSDLISVTGALTISAGTVPSTVFTIAPVTLNGANQAAALTDFDPSHAYSFLLATAGTSTGFAPNKFTVNTSGFLNSLAGGSFVVAQSSGAANLLLQFIPVTPPASAFWGGSQSSAWNSASGGLTNFYSDASGTTNTALPGAVTDLSFSTGNVNVSNLNTSLGQDFAVKGVTFTSAGVVPVTIGGTNTLTLGSNGLAVQSGSASPTISAPVVLGVSQIWTNNSANALSVSGSISGPGSALTISGPGAIVLTGANTYAGGTTINGGSQGGVLSGTTNSIQGTITDNGKLDITQSVSGILRSPIIGSGDVTANVSAGAIVTLTGSNTYTGTTTVSSGTLSVSTSSVGTGTLTTTGGGTLDYTQSGPGTANNNITGTGKVSFGGNAISANGAGGTLTYTAVDNASGGTTVSSGKLVLSHAGGGALTGPVAIATGASVALGSSNQIQEPSTVLLTLAGGTLAAGGHSDGTPAAAALGKLMLTGSQSTLDFGDATGASPTTLSFADSASLTWTGTVTLINYSAGQDSLYIGTSRNLSAVQLSAITFGGVGASQLPTGQVVFAPEPNGLLPLLVGIGLLGGMITWRRSAEVRRT